MMAVNLIHNNSLKVEGMGSLGRCAMIDQPKKSRYCINMVYVSPVKRGCAEIIEDVMPIYNIAVSLKTDKQIKRVYLGVSDEDLEYTLENGVLKWWKLREPVSTVSKTSKESFESIPCEYCELTQEEAEPAHRGILRNFTNSILFGEELIAPGFDGVNELMLSNAAYLSEWEGNSEIALPLDAQRFDALLSERIKTSKYNYDKTSSLPAGAYSERWKVKWE